MLLLLPARWSSAWRRLFLGPVSHAQLSFWHHQKLFQGVQTGRGGKRNCLIGCESFSCYGSLWREAVLSSSSCLQHTEVSAKGREKEAMSVCLSAWPCPLLQHIWGNADMVTSAEQEQDTFPQSWAAGHVWRPAVTVKALQSSPSASQESSRKFGHFPFSVEVTALHTLAYSISQWLFLGEGEKIQWNALGSPSL